MQRNRGTLLGAYIWYHRRGVAAFVLSDMLFLSVYALYHLPLEPVLYAVLMAGVLWLLFGFCGFLRFCRKYRCLAGAVRAGVQNGIQPLPEVENALEGCYQKLIEALDVERAALSSQADKRRAEMSDYYTLWAHQIKTPIAAIRLLLQAEEEPPKLEQELFKIEQYVEMVLQYQRLESIASDLVLVSCPLDGMVRQAVKKYASVFIHKKLALSLGELPGTVVTDEKWMVFVLEQLLSNALKYTASGTISIYLDADNTLVIADTGIGIRAEDLPRLGERGFTGYNGRMDKKASGLGLFLCRRVLDRLGHSFSVASAVGQGTQVYIGLRREQLD